MRIFKCRFVAWGHKMYRIPDVRGKIKVYPAPIDTWSPVRLAMSLGNFYVAEIDDRHLCWPSQEASAPTTASNESQKPHLLQA